MRNAKGARDAGLASESNADAGGTAARFLGRNSDRARTRVRRKRARLTGYGQISRYSHSRTRAFEATPEHGERCGITAASSRPFIVGLWWMCEDNECKTFKTKEEVRGMGREQQMLTITAAAVLLLTSCSSPYPIGPPV